MFDKVVVAIDDSEHASAVIDAATEIALKSNSEVHVLHVLEVGFVGRAGAVNLEDSDATHQRVDDAVASMKAKGINVDGTVVAAMHPDVAAVINDQAVKTGATAIVTGTRGLSQIGGLMVGSTTHKLLHLVRIPVLVIP